MKAKTLLTTVLLTICSITWAQDEPSSAMVFETYEWDFGTIEEADGPVSHTFRFANISNNPIQIDNIATVAVVPLCNTLQDPYTEEITAS